MKSIFFLFFISMMASCRQSVSNKKDIDTITKNDTVLSQITVYHDECTGCMDVIVDSGKVYVPLHVQAGFRPGVKDRDLRPTKLSTWSMRLESDSVFEMLFGPEGDFNRRFRIWGMPVGLRDSSFVIFKVDRFERIKDREW